MNKLIEKIDKDLTYYFSKENGTANSFTANEKIIIDKLNEIIDSVNYLIDYNNKLEDLSKKLLEKQFGGEDNE